MIKKIVAIFLFGLFLTGFFACQKTTSDPICSSYTCYIPNSFKPNGDGIDDYFSAKGTGIVTYEMWIYNASGSQIFHTTNINTPWDGRVQGGTINYCPEGVYTYTIKTTDECSNTHTYTGEVILIN